MKSGEQIPQMPTKYFMNLLNLGITKLLDHVYCILSHIWRTYVQYSEIGNDSKENIEIQFISLPFLMSEYIFIDK